MIDGPLYICLEGGEGTYKTTTAKALREHFESRGFRCLLTKEPGSPHLPVTMLLRELMLSNEYAGVMTPIAREFISQAIRSIHMAWLEKVQYDYDVIIQDRGVMSGMVYASACGHDDETIDLMNTITLEDIAPCELYDYVFVLMNDDNGLEIAANAKQEFTTGDAMEDMGPKFHSEVNELFREFAEYGSSSVIGINVTGKDTDTICDEIFTGISVFAGVNR